MNGIRRDWPGWQRRERGNLLVISVALSLTLGAYFWRLYLLRVRYFNPDEFEHLHAAWCISKGMLLYRDFFELHTPWLHFFLAQFYTFFDVETNVAGAQAFLFFARTWMWVFTGLILVWTLWLGRLWRDARVGCVAALFLANTLMFFRKTLEVRPDVLSVTVWLACLIAVVRGIRDEETGRNPRWRFLWSGIFLGAAVMCTQKMLFAFPGFGLAMLWYLLDPRSRGTHRQRLRNVAYQVAGFCLPVLLTFGYFAFRGALGQFIEYNFLLTSRWKFVFTPTYDLKQLVKDNPILVGLALVGFFRALFRTFEREPFRRGEPIYVLSALGLFVGLFIIQAPHQQYYLMFLPLGAVFASDAFLDAMDSAAAALHGEWARHARFILCVLAGTCAFIALLLLAPKIQLSWAEATVYLARVLGRSHTDWLPTTFDAGRWLVALVSAAVCLLFAWRNLAVAVLLVGLSLYPFKEMRDEAATLKNTEVLGEIRYVLNNTSATDTCMDGWTGLGVFRQHASFYWFLPQDLRAMLSESTKHDLAVNLRSGSIAPKLIFYDYNLKDLSDETAQFFEDHYESVGKGRIWRRKK
jgi:hypothetical protein